MTPLPAQQMSDVDLSTFDGHTQGPWRPYSPRKGSWCVDPVAHVTTTVEGDRESGRKQREIDARLIAAAPELLAECKAQRAELERLRAEREGLRKRLIACIPTNWCDPLLTGPDRVLPSDGKYNGTHIEKLLLGIKSRMEALTATHADEAKGESHG